MENYKDPEKIKVLFFVLLFLLLSIMKISNEHETFILMFRCSFLSVSCAEGFVTTHIKDKYQFE